MKTANQLTFTTYEASLKLKPDDSIKVIFDTIDWSFVHQLVQDKYSKTAQGADGYDPISLLKSQLLIYLGEVSSDRRLVSTMPGFVSSAALTSSRPLPMAPLPTSVTGLGDDLFYEILHQLIAQTIVLKVITGGDTAIDSTHLWAYSNKFGKKSCSCKGKCGCPRVYSDTLGTQKQGIRFLWLQGPSYCGCPLPVAPRCDSDSGQ